MGTAGATQSDEGSPLERQAGWFERELADLNAQLDAVAAWLATRPVRNPADHARDVHPAMPGATAGIGRGLHASGRAPEPPAATAPDQEAVSSEQPTPAPVPPPTASEPSAERPAPTGTDLSDPKNFGLMPPTAHLQPGDVSPEEYRHRLARDLAFATTVLHTSKVPAAVWREWRVFEKAIHEKLHDL